CHIFSDYVGNLNADEGYSSYTTPLINYRLSPPNTDNYYYIPTSINTSQYNGWFARIKYRWNMNPPIANLIDDSEIITHCPTSGVIDLQAVTQRATYMQWEYSNWSGPGDCPPENAVWHEVPPTFV